MKTILVPPFVAKRKKQIYTVAFALDSHQAAITFLFISLLDRLSPAEIG
jgi:hypothetical protein